MDYVTHGRELGQYACLALTDMEYTPSGKVQIQEAPYAPIHKGSDKEGSAVEVTAISLGDLAFAVVPYEMFCQSGQFIKENSPFQMTFVATCANYDGGYMPTQECYYYDGKESYEGSKCRYEVGTAEILAQKYVDLLSQLHETRSSTTLLIDEPELPLYWSVDRGTERTANPDGTVDARFLCDGELITLPVHDMELMERIDRDGLVVPVINDGVIVMSAHLSEMPQYSLLCRDYCVQSMGGSTVKVNANERLSGKELVLDGEFTVTGDLFMESTATLETTEAFPKTATRNADGSLTIR